MLVHINIYLPTSATLQAVIDDAKETHPTALIYVKGDANASLIQRPNNKRDQIFKAFLEFNKFLHLSLNNHKTYHHFMGDGNSDSNIDVCLSSPTSADGTPSSSEEKLLEIFSAAEMISGSPTLTTTSSSLLYSLLPRKPAPMMPDLIILPLRTPGTE